MVKIPEGKIYHVPEDLEEALEEVSDIDISPRNMGERVRKDDFHVEYGGPKWFGSIYMILEVPENEDEVRDNVIEIIGPDVDEVPEGSTFPIGMQFKVWGSEIQSDYDEFFMRQMADHLESMEGLMAVNTQKTWWMRVAKRVADTFTLRKMCQAVIALTKSAFPIAEKMEAKVIIGSPEVGGAELIQEVLKNEIQGKWDLSDSRRLGLEDDDVDSFYSCTLCQGFAPNHVCILAPERMPFCGIISYRGAQIGMEIDPHGYLDEIPKEEAVSKQTGQYKGINDYIFERTNRTIKRVNLYSTIKYPMTS
jgi:acetyl-CoA synthase